MSCLISWWTRLPTGLRDRFNEVCADAVLDSTLRETRDLDVNETMRVRVQPFFLMYHWTMIEHDLEHRPFLSIPIPNEPWLVIENPQLAHGPRVSHSLL
jgi:hypothetical protein